MTESNRTLSDSVQPALHLSITAALNRVRCKRLFGGGDHSQSFLPPNDCVIDVSVLSGIVVDDDALVVHVASVAIILWHAPDVHETSEHPPTALRQRYQFINQLLESFLAQAFAL